MDLKHLPPVMTNPTILLIVILTLAPADFAQSTFRLLHAFGGTADGIGVCDSVVFDQQGNLYGTTSGGGAYGYGSVFEMTPNGDGTWTESVLHSFMDNDPDGYAPTGGLVIDAGGNLYGTATLGGTVLDVGGTVFELSPGSGGWSLTVLHSFPSSTIDGIKPYAGLVMDEAGNLYGTAPYGGANGDGGIVFELTPAGAGTWTYSILYSFCALANCSDGNAPVAGLIQDMAGNLYGTTESGGNLAGEFCGLPGCGVAFEVSPGSGNSWSESILHKFGSFQGDGQKPITGNLAFDSAGRLYGTTGFGGAGCSDGCGTVFRLTRGSAGEWRETILYDFKSGPTGNVPGAGVVVDRKGNLYGTTGYGGSGSDCGVVYKLTPGANGTWTYTVLHTFTSKDGCSPDANPILRNGKLYGTTDIGGPNGGGVVYQIIP